jgi:hypothetical protein
VQHFRQVAGVDHSLLRSWLGLPPGPWPPDHYALLGLPPGRCDPAAAEPLVLARMDRLRPHQLLHPELVTEGMNRLAQALICLTDPAARAAYDAELGVRAAPSLLLRTRQDPVPPGATAGSPEPAPEPEPDFLLVLRDLGDVSSEPPSILELTQVIEVPFTPDLAPPARPYEVVEPAPQPLPPAYELVPDEEVSREPQAVAVQPYEEIEAAIAPPAAGPWQPAGRRELYARLVALRRLLVAWRRLGPVLADPRESADRPARVLGFLEAVAEVRGLLAAHGGLVGEPDRPGGLVAALVGQPLVLATLRSLIPGQRRVVAIDWRRTEEVLEREQLRLRELSRSGRQLKRRSRRWRVIRRMVRTPEVLLIALVVVVILSALLRRSRGP